MNRLKKLIALFSSGIILTCSTSAFSHTSDATTGTRYYWRHDCNSVNATSYTEYSLDFSEPTAAPITIIGNNDMVRDYDTSIVRLSSGGTGFIIDKHTIATAAHCVFSTSTHKFIDITVDIVDSNNSVIAKLSPTYLHITKNFGKLNAYNSTYDYALITVKEDLTDYGMFHLAVARDEYISKLGKVIVSGFPQKYPSEYEGSNWGIRFKSSGNLVDYKSSYNIHYDADTSNGDSGGPVYVEEGATIAGQLYQYKSVIGIHVSSSPDYNNGVRITDDILQFYYENNYII